MAIDELMSRVDGKVSPEAAANIKAWLTEPKYAMYADAVQQMILDEQWKELEDAFFKVVEFGTGGRRGTTGVGSNRINKVTIGESAQALCRYVAGVNDQAADQGIVIAYDTRLSSEELSQYTATVCAANGFKVYLFEGFRATPELSFAVRHLGAAAGIVISASHNPPADNGFKAYWSDGGQLVAPHDRGVLDEVANITTIATMDYQEALRSGRIQLIGEAVDAAYYRAVTTEALGQDRDLKIIYSPLHGAGQTSVLPALRHAGFVNISTVTSQMVPDGHFPTVPGGKANPEESGANQMAVEQMLAEGADITITNDPDADRIGVMVNQRGKAIQLNGNQSAALAADFALQRLQSAGELSSKHYLAKTIVTTELLAAVAQAYGATLYTNMLVGFKFISDLIRRKEGTDEVFVLGGEESYGLLKGMYARDKDGAAGALMLAEYAAQLKSEGKTLYDRLLELFDEHGIYYETLANVQLPGADGFKRMQAIMARLRNNPPTSLAGYDVSAVSDYTTLTRRDITTGREGEIDCLAGNVLVFELGDSRRRVTVRPSGTEPKLKLYVQWFAERDKELGTVDEQYITVIDDVTALTKRIEQEILNE